MNACVELAGRNVLRGNGAGIVPVSGEGIDQGQVLANGGVSVVPASRRLENSDGLVGVASERQGQTVVGFTERWAGDVERRYSITLLAQCDLDQGKLQHHLRLVRIEAQRVLEGGFGRVEAATGVIGIAEQRAEAGIGRRL